MRSPEVRKVQHGAEDATLEGLAAIAVHRVADAHHAAEVQQVDLVARRQLFRDVAGVAEQRMPVAQRTDDDVAALDLRHAARGQLEGVVGGLVRQHLDGDDDAFLAGDLRSDLHLAAEPAALRDRGDLVDDQRAHD
jgi:hypothetical protein